MVGNSEGKRSLRKPRREWEDVIKMNTFKIRRKGVDWDVLGSGSDQWRVLIGNFLTTWAYHLFLKKFSRRKVNLGREHQNAR